MITDRCLKRDEMEQYLNGWSDESVSSSFEQHLAECSECEQTIGRLESELQIDLPGQVVIAGEDRSDAGNGGDLNETIESIRNWNGHPPETTRNLMPPMAQTVSGNFGNYELFELIGRGGMAEVYRARHKRLQRDVALKLIRVPRWHMAESMNRIEREIRAVGKLRHPSIVNAVDAGEHEGVQFLVTEFIDGMDLGRIARAVGPMPISDACEMVRVAALGLDHAHANGIVHRDIKPSSLMLDKSGAVKILDFGLVHLEGWTGVSAEVTSVGQLLGTLDYMAPEQADRADNVNHRSDVYSLGATLFRLLCGRAPYAATSNQSPLEKLRLLANERPPCVETLRPDLPADLAGMINRSLDRDPSNRPASAAHLAESLQPFCDRADLPALLNMAESQADTDSEKVFPSVDSGYPSIASLASGSEGVSPTVAGRVRSSGRTRYVSRFLIGLAMFSAAVFAGIVLILETQKGQVIIETDSPNVHVELVADGVIRKEIELVPGENMTRIYAGRYEIRITDGTDRYVIDRNAFVLKRGEKVIARITVDESAKKAVVAWSENGRAFQMPTSGAPAYRIPQQWTTERRSLVVYPVRGDVDTYVRILSTVLEGQEDTRLEGDAGGSRLVIYTSGRTHLEIRKLIDELEKTAVDAEAGAGVERLNTRLVTRTYTIDGDLVEATRFVQAIVADFPNVTVVPFVANNCLVISATQNDHELVAVLVSKIALLKQQLAASGNSGQAGNPEIAVLESRLSIAEQLLEQMNGSGVTAGPPNLFSSQVYEGKSLEEWLNTLKFDISTEVKIRAGNAVSRLARADADTFKTVSRMIAIQTIEGSPVDWARFVVPQMSLADDDMKTLLEFIPNADPARVRVILELSKSVGLYSIAKEKYSDVIQFLRFVDQAESVGNLYENPDDAGFVRELFVELINASKPTTAQDRSGNPNAESMQINMYRFVLDSPHLGPEQVRTLQGRTSYWPDSLKSLFFEASVRKLETIFLSDEGAEVVVAELSRNLDYGTEEMRERMLAVFDRLLSDMESTPDLLSEVVFRSAGFSRSGNATLSFPGAEDNTSGAGRFPIFVFGSGLRFIPAGFIPRSLVLDILLLFDRAAGNSVPTISMAGIRAVHDATAERHAEFMKMIPNIETVSLSAAEDGFLFIKLSVQRLETELGDLAAHQDLAMGALLHEVAGGLLAKHTKEEE